MKEEKKCAQSGAVDNPSSLRSKGRSDLNGVIKSDQNSSWQPYYLGEDGPKQTRQYTTFTKP